MNNFRGPGTAGLRARIASFDRRVDVGFDRIRGNRVADRIFYTASAAGEFSAIWFAFAILRAARGDTEAALRAALAIGAESAVVNLGIKSFFRRSRPVFEGVRPHRLRTPRTTSFPSGHATSSLNAATLLADGDPLLAPVLFALAGLVAVSRIHVRIHHGSDVIGGALLGLASGYLIKTLFPLAESSRRLSG